MEQGFIDILQTVLKDHGKAVFLDVSKCKALLADYTKGEYKKESRLLFHAIDAKVTEAINKSQEIDICRKQQVRLLYEEYSLREERAKDIVDALVLVLRNIEKEKNYCKKCKKELPDDWKACPYCGEALSSRNESQIAVTQPLPVKLSSSLVINGNTPGNTANCGLVAFQDGWLYFVNHKDGDKLYKLFIDATGCFSNSEIVTIDKCAYLNIQNNWIYYQNKDDGNTIYKIRTNGTERTKLNNYKSVCINVSDEWIYYLTLNDGYKGGYISKVTINGTKHQQIAYFNNIVYLIMADNYLYYCLDDWRADDKLIQKYKSSNVIRIFRMNTDGTNQQKLNDDFSYYVCPHDDWIYYNNSDDSNKIYKIKTDGTDRQLLCNDDGADINTDDDWVYYLNESNGMKLFKIKKDGTCRTKLSNDSGGLINIAGDWIFYINFDDNNNLYRIRKDGTDRFIVK